MDAHGHGTHVAGIVAATGNNGAGITGVSWNAKIMACKVYTTGSAVTSTYVSRVASSIVYSVKNGADIINISSGTPAMYGIEDYSDKLRIRTLEDAVNYARNKDVIIVASAGNFTPGNTRNNDTIMMNYPASIPMDNIVSVISTNNYENLSDDSRFGKVTLDLAAPGLLIYSTWLNNSYFKYSGTSMAAPHVSGAIALLKSQFPLDNYLQIINRLFSSVKKTPQLVGKCQTEGMLHMKDLLSSSTTTPANDDIFSSYPLGLSGAPYFISTGANNYDATFESDEPNHAGLPPNHSIWWSWAPTNTTYYSISTEGSGINSRLAVYSGSNIPEMATLLEVASSAENGHCGAGKVLFYAFSGVQYYIALDGEGGEYGPLQLSLEEVFNPQYTEDLDFRFNLNDMDVDQNSFTMKLEGPPNVEVWFFDTFSGWRVVGLSVCQLRSIA